MRRRRHDALTEAVRAVDLPALIAEHFPASQAQPGKAGVVYAAWRGNSNTPALSLSRKDGVWLWHDHATGEGGNAFDFLVKVEGLPPQDAARHLLARAGVSLDDAGLKPVAPDIVERLAALPTGVVIPALANRGFNKAIVERYGIRRDGDDALIPITSPEGVVMNVKRRFNQPYRGMRYTYEVEGHGAPPWCSPDARRAPVLFIVEGELNAIIAHAALQEAGETEVGVMGMAGANTDLYPGLCRGKTVYVYADDDEAGEKAVAAWAERAHEDGAKSVHVCPPNFQDFCDHAGKEGRPGLAVLLTALFAAAEQRFGALDRMLANGSVRDYLRDAERYIQGGVIHRTGITALDRKTGGIRESGVFSVAGLSSMGKSMLLRRFLIEHVRDEGVVRLYSPDQSPRSVYRLLASLLSGVGLEEVRTGSFSDDTLRLWGDPDRARQAWREAHEHVILELSQRFQVTEEGEAKAIFDDMERAVDQGVTMFGIDYLQGIEPSDHRDRDGQVAKDLRKLAHRLRVPVVSALQLAKYKFPPSRRSGLPVGSDIEGSGGYFQDSEMVFMVYNDAIYMAKYAGPETEPTNDTPGEARLLVTKDKEGGGDETFYMRWVPRLLTYCDNLFPWDLAKEREGLM